MRRTRGYCTEGLRVSRVLLSVAYLLLLVLSAGCLTATQGNTGPSPLAQIKAQPSQYVDKEMTLDVWYGNPGRKEIGPRLRRADWPVYDAGGGIYVNGTLPSSLDRYSEKDWGKPLRIRARVMKHPKGGIYLKLLDVVSRP